MNILETIFLAIVQGITEWLPISSSGHLVLFEEWFQIQGATLEFDIFLHLASVVVIVLFFRKEIKEVLLSFNKPDKEKKNWFWYLVLSSIFTAVIGYSFYNQIDLVRTTDSVANLLIVTSVLLLATKFIKGEKAITWQSAIVLGIVQGLAVLPGLSRSGVVIAVALIMGVKKKDAFSYAFLLAIPAILGSFLLTATNFIFNWTYLIGFLVTILVGYLTLAWLKLIIKNNHLYLFFIYTLLVGLIIKIWL